MPVTHTFVSPAPAVPGKVDSVAWNDVHTIAVVNADVDPAAAIGESKLSLNYPTHALVTIGTASGLSLVGQVLSLALATSGVTGALSGIDWDTFNGKQAALGYTPVDIASASWVDLTDGGATTLHTHAGGGTPAGADTNIQYNDGGAFGGDANLTWNKITSVLNLRGQGGANAIIQGESSPASGGITLHSGNATVIDTSGGTFEIISGTGNNIGNGGQVNISTGQAGTVGDGGGITLFPGVGGSTSGNGGPVVITGGDAIEGNGGYVELKAGLKGGAGTDGYIILADQNSGIGAIMDMSLIATSSKIFTFPNASGTLMLAGNNLSDLTNAATARTNLGLVAGGAGDIWVAAAGDTMTGLLTVTPSTPGNSITTTGEVTINTGANAEPGLTIVGNGFFQTGKLFTINDNYWGDRLTVDKLGQIRIILNPGTADSAGLLLVSSPTGATLTEGLNFTITNYGASATYVYGINGSAGNYAYANDAYTNQAYGVQVQLYQQAESGKVATATDFVGVNIKTPAITGAGTKAITNTFGIRIFNQGAGEVNYNKALFIDDQSGAYYENYAIYTKAGLVHFGDSVDLASGKNITMIAGNIITDTTTGTKIGAAAAQKLGFWNATPVVQPSGANQAALTNSTGGTYNGTLVDVGLAFSQVNINDNFTDVHTLLNEIRTALVNSGIIKGAA